MLRCMERVLLRRPESSNGTKLMQKNYSQITKCQVGLYQTCIIIQKYPLSIFLIHVPRIFYYFVLWPTNVQLFHNYQQLHFKYLCNLAMHWLQAAWGWNNSFETCGSVIICEIIVHLLVIVQNIQYLIYTVCHQLHIMYRELCKMSQSSLQ